MGTVEKRWIWKEREEGRKQKDKNNIGRRKEKDSAISQTSVCSQ